jgi:hypothetical protein
MLVAGKLCSHCQIHWHSRDSTSCCTACTLLLCLQDDVRSFYFDGLPILDVHERESFRAPLYFKTSKHGTICAGYITPYPLEGFRGCRFMDLLRLAEGRQPRNFVLFDDQIEVGCCVCTPLCVVCTSRVCMFSSIRNNHRPDRGSPAKGASVDAGLGCWTSHCLSCRV